MKVLASVMRPSLMSVKVVSADLNKDFKFFLHDLHDRVYEWYLLCKLDTMGYY